MAENKVVKAARKEIERLQKRVDSAEANLARSIDKLRTATATRIVVLQDEIDAHRRVIDAYDADKQGADDATDLQGLDQHTL